MLVAKKVKQALIRNMKRPFTQAEDSNKKIRLDSYQNRPKTQEHQVGITEFILNEGPSLAGQLKQRYSDFIVNEIDLQGKVVSLQTTQVPTELKTKKITDLSKEELENMTKTGLQILKEKFNVADPILQQIEQMTTHPEHSLAIDNVKIVNEKEERTAIHQLFKSNFPSLISDTVSLPNGDKALRLQIQSTVLQNLKEKKSDTFHPRSIWPANRPSYLAFTLCKENYDTMGALNALSRSLKCPPKIFSIAGTKDKRGITSQRVTAFKIDVEKMAQAANHLKSIAVGDYCYVNDQLRLGELKGNRFSIVIRDVNIVSQGEEEQANRIDADEYIKKRCQNIQQYGFVNYFGMQRFGQSVNFPTHQTGIHVLKGNYKEVISNVLQSKIEDIQENREEKNRQVKSVLETYLQDWNAKAALQKLPKHCHSERSLLTGLSKSGDTDFYSGFNGLPRILRMMYVHGYQSYIWNQMASLRLKTYGMQPVIGDMVSISKEELNSTADQDEPITAEEDAEMEDVKEESDKNNSMDVKWIETEEDLKKYTIDDVVLPIIGSQSLFPKHKVGKEAIEQMLSQNGVTLDHFKKLPKSQAAYGAYRLLIARPYDIEYRSIRYSDATIPLVNSDLDLLQGKNNENYPNVEDKDAKRGIVIKFSLASSCYATMLVRELLKQSSVEK